MVIARVPMLDKSTSVKLNEGITPSLSKVPKRHHIAHRG